MLRQRIPYSWVTQLKKPLSANFELVRGTTRLFPLVNVRSLVGLLNVKGLFDPYRLHKNNPSSLVTDVSTN